MISEAEFEQLLVETRNTAGARAALIRQRRLERDRDNSRKPRQPTLRRWRCNLRPDAAIACPDRATARLFFKRLFGGRLPANAVITSERI